MKINMGLSLRDLGNWWRVGGHCNERRKKGGNRTTRVKRALIQSDCLPRLQFLSPPRAKQNIFMVHSLRHYNTVVSMEIERKERQVSYHKACWESPPKETSQKEKCIRTNCELGYRINSLTFRMRENQEMIINEIWKGVSMSVHEKNSESKLEKKRWGRRQVIIKMQKGISVHGERSSII